MLDKDVVAVAEMKELLRAKLASKGWVDNSDLNMISHDAYNLAHLMSARSKE
jgi:hypothetical protein